MVVKGITIESGMRPVICIPVMGEDKEAVLAETRRVLALGAVMIEWRIDYLKPEPTFARIRDILEELAKLCKQSILLVTLRTRRQGGLAAVAEPDLSRLYRQIAELHLADLLDVEFFEVEQPRRLLRELHGEGARIITSHHDFHQTPESGILKMLLEQMEDGGADIVKLAVMPQTAEDVLRLLQVTWAFTREYPGVPAASMAMGSLGVISRLSGEVFGSCLTFGTMGKSSAPGQIKEEELRQVLDIIHENS
jgi:3-dehydroquinate dehydratase-1